MCDLHVIWFDITLFLLTRAFHIDREIEEKKIISKLQKQNLKFSVLLQKKRSMPGDWVCESCQRLNFNWRQYCRKCNKPFVGKKGTNTQEQHSPRIVYFRPGDWYCDAGVCRAHNYASRYNCFKCGAVKIMPSFGGSLQYYNHVFPHMNFGFYGIMGGLVSRRGWMPGDWFCGRYIKQLFSHTNTCTRARAHTHSLTHSLIVVAHYICCIKINPLTITGIIQVWLQCTQLWFPNEMF